MKDVVQLGHGGGGRLSRDLIEREISPRFEILNGAGLADAATIASSGADLLFTTDSFVVHPLFFPGGNIGSLAVHGTVNDLAVCGGRPRYLSLAMILEEGLALDDLRTVLDTICELSTACGVTVVTGDTKVVRRGQCDGMYLTTTGIGERIPNFALDLARIKPGDKVLVSGPLGDHGMAVMAAREGFPGGPELLSDTASVHRLVESIADIAAKIKFMRDPTRGGLAAVLNEICNAQPFGALINESRLPFSVASRALGEMLGLDLLQVASEGRVVAVVDSDASEQVLKRWRALQEGARSALIGEISPERGRVVLETVSGGRRLIDLPLGELLPRIC